MNLLKTDDSISPEICIYLLTGLNKPRSFIVWGKLSQRLESGKGLERVAPSYLALVKKGVSSILRLRIAFNQLIDEPCLLLGAVSYVLMYLPHIVSVRM